MRLASFLDANSIKDKRFDVCCMFLMIVKKIYIYIKKFKRGRTVKKAAVFLAVIMLLLIMTPTEVLVVSAEGSQKIFINEIMASNSQTVRDGDVEDEDEGDKGGAYSDWIEIYNAETQPIDLTGYSLSDSSATWTLPQCTIEAKGYLIIWASDKGKVAKDGQLHTNFKLSASGEDVVLKMPNGTIVDSVTFASLSDDQSYGRKTDGASEFELFTKSTPLDENANGIVLVKDPVFSKVGGFYTGEFDLLITTDISAAKIYYTTDGSDPLPESSGTIQYSNGIKIRSRAGEENVLSMIQNISSDTSNPWKAPKGEVFKCTTVKAVVMKEDGTKSNIITHSYFVDPNMETRYTLPIISVVTDYDNLFDPVTGIYTKENSEKTGDEWEKPAHIEFFESDGNLGLSQNVGVRIHGGYSRKYPQKSFRIYADGEYGDSGEFKYEIFPGLTKNGNGKNLKSFERLIIRDAGNDWAFGYMRDEMMQSLVSHINGLDTQAYRPAILFLNGEYWGVYYIRERYDKEYLEDHYNLDDNKVAIIVPKQISFGAQQTIEVQEGTSEDADAYTNDVINYLKSNSITQESTYEYIKTKIDIDNYINYNVAEIFFGNTDWPGNNVAIWKYKTDGGKYQPEAPYGQDGRWRWLLKDTDFGFGLYNKAVTHDTLKYAAGDRVEGAGNPEWSTFLFKTLLQNTEFRNQFINCFADQLNTSFVSERVLQIINEFESTLSPEIVEHTDRWQYLKMTAVTTRDTTWNQNVQVIKDYAKNRPSNVIQFIKNKFSTNGVNGTANITLNADSSKGYVKINTIDINSSTPSVKDPSKWTGMYFTGIPVTVTAIPKDGYVFDHWEGIIGSSNKVTFTHTGESIITAVFKQDTATTPTPTHAITPTPTATSSFPGDTVLGDVSEDGYFNSIDFGLVRMYLLGLKKEDEINKSAGDVDANGALNAIDFAYLRQRLLGIINKFPAE